MSDPSMWAEVVSDKGDWTNKVARKLVDLIHDHIVAGAEAAKN